MGGRIGPGFSPVNRFVKLSRQDPPLLPDSGGHAVVARVGRGAPGLGHGIGQASAGGDGGLERAAGGGQVLEAEASGHRHDDVGLVRQGGGVGLRGEGGGELAHQPVAQAAQLRVSDQARELEALGIATYLHVPSPGLLRMFLKEGARRFIFEGQECGGHIGPRSSFALWESMLALISEHTAAKPADDLHVVLAGGIHDALSSSMVAALTARIARKGAKVGVLLGTAYLFTKEAFQTGAITEKFQQEAVRCAETVLLEARGEARAASSPAQPDR